MPGLGLTAGLTKPWNLPCPRALTQINTAADAPINLAPLIVLVIPANYGVLRDAEQPTAGTVR